VTSGREGLRPMRAALQAGLILALLLTLKPAGEAEALQENRRAELRRRIHTVKTWELKKDLDLSEDQARSFFPLMESHDEERGLLREERRSVESELDSLLALDGPRAEREILGKLERLKIIDRKQAARDEEYERRLGRILTPQQQARYELFERNFKARLKEMIRDIQREDEGPATRERKEEPDGKSSDRQEKKDGNSQSDGTKDKSGGAESGRASKSHTGDGEKDKSGSKADSRERSSRGKGASRNPGADRESLAAAERR